MVGLSVLLALAIGSHEDVPVLHRRPSLVIAGSKTFARDLGVTLEARDLEGVVRIYGTEEGIAEAKRLLAMFDVKSREVALRFRVRVPVDKVDYSGTATVANLTVFRFGDGSSRMDVEYTPRITEKSTIQNGVSVRIDEARFTGHAEVKHGEPFVLKVAELQPLNQAAEHMIKFKDPRELPVIQLTPSIVEEKPKK